jgi:hypothetical protein
VVCRFQKYLKSWGSVATPAERQGKWANFRYRGIKICITLNVNQSILLVLYCVDAELQIVKFQYKSTVTTKGINILFFF